MTDRRYLLAFLAALLTAALSTMGVYSVVVGAAEPRVPTRLVVVTASDLPGGTSLERAALKTVEWPVHAIPKGAVTSVDSLVGRVVRADVVRGVPLVPEQLAPVGARAGLEGEIAAGRRAMAVRVTEAAGAAGLVRADSRVDVLVSLRDDMSGVGTVARMVMSDVRVLAVGSRADQMSADGKPVLGAVTQSPIVTLEVTPAQAEQLAAIETQGLIQLVLRGYGSHETVASGGANAREVLGLPREPVTRAPAVAAAPTPAPAPLAAAPARPVIPTPTPTPVPARVPVESLEVRVFRGATTTRQFFAPPAGTSIETRPSALVQPMADQRASTQSSRTP